MENIKKQCSQWPYLLITLLLITNKATANNFSGDWSWLNNSLLDSTKISLQQNNATLSGHSQSQCGLISITGASNENALGLNLEINKTKNSCPNWVQLTASCSNSDCSTIQGTWYDSNHLMGNLTWIKENKDFYISIPDPGSIFVIDPQLTMPSLNFAVTNNYPPALLKWSLKVDFHWRRGRTSATLPAVIINTNDYTPDLSSWGVIGGNLTANAIYNPSNPNSKTAIASYKIYGTNPGKSLIDSEIKDPIQSKIACVESVYRQFEAPSGNGQGLPLIGKNDDGEKIGGVGIMQVIHKKIILKTVWNWRANLEDGLTMFNAKREKAKRLHINERIRLNADRKKLGLPSCPENIPSPLTPDQVTRDSIRRYNYGVEYRWEPRNGKACAGQWVISPSCVRHPLNGCDKEYVNKVLQCTV